MAKKRKSRPAEGPNGPKPYDAKDGKIGPVNTYEDVANSEDEFFINRDKILLDEGPEAKRRRKIMEDDAFLEPSDEEILSYDDESEEEEEEEFEDNGHDSAAERPKTSRDAVEGEADEDEDAGGWGSSKRDYYDADNIQTEEDAREEEAEAKRLQKKKLQKMSEADFGFDENEWLDAGAEEDEGEVVTEVLKDVEITENMSAEERLQLLHTRYPEFESLANEFVELHPLLKELKAEATSTAKHLADIAVVKSRALAAYLGALTMYFAVLTSTAQTSNGKSPALDPMELRDHSIMESLLQCREMWLKAKTLEATAVHIDAADEEAEEEEGLDIEEESIDEPIEERQTKRKRKELAREAAAEKAKLARQARLQAAEADLADLSSLMPNKRSSKPSKSSTKPVTAADSESDFGEEEALDARTAAQKAERKKSLRFYTSQIVQKSNKRAGAGRDAGGDTDLPYRERLRDRQARLNAEAEKRGQMLDANGRGTALEDNSENDEDDDGKADDMGDEEDDYYDMIASTSKSRKAAKESKYADFADAKAAAALDRVPEEGDVADDGKRQINRMIEKNRGLTAKRSKLVRNPRVKRRVKWEKAKKKLASMRAVYKGGEDKSGYAGEKTGIKTGLVKSVKL